MGAVLEHDGVVGGIPYHATMVVDEEHHRKVLARRAEQERLWHELWHQGQTACDCSTLADREGEGLP